MHLYRTYFQCHSGQYSRSSRVAIERVRRDFPRRTRHAELDSSYLKAEGGYHVMFTQAASASICLEGTSWAKASPAGGSRRSIPSQLLQVNWNELHIKTPCWAKYGNTPSMVDRNGCKSVYDPIGTGETNSLWKVIVCYGAFRWLCLRSYKRKCWVCYIVVTREQPEWKLWREAMCGGLTLTNVWRRLLGTVKHVSQWRAAQQ